MTEFVFGTQVNSILVSYSFTCMNDSVYKDLL